MTYYHHLDWKTNGVIQGMESVGAKYIKNDTTHLYFDIPKGSTLDDEEKLNLAALGCRITPFKLKVRIVEK